MTKQKKNHETGEKKIAMQNPMMFTFPKKGFRTLWRRMSSRNRDRVQSSGRQSAARQKTTTKKVVVKTDKGSCRYSSHIGNVGSHNAHVNSHNGNVILFR